VGAIPRRGLPAAAASETAKSQIQQFRYVVVRAMWQTERAGTGRQPSMSEAWDTQVFTGVPRQADHELIGPPELQQSCKELHRLLKSKTDADTDIK